MDIYLVERLATAAASLDAAKDQVESGSPQWSAISSLQMKVQELIELEVVGMEIGTEEE